MPANGISNSEKTDLISDMEAAGELLHFEALVGAGLARLDSREECCMSDRVLPRVTRFYDEHIRHSAYYDQLRRIVEPSSQELEGSGHWDTSGELDNTVMPGLQHKYPQTALILATDKCFSYCRFCFRKRLIGSDLREIATDYREIAKYIQNHPEVSNVLLSGGDPFVLSTNQLQRILDHLLPISHLTAIRFGTRAMVYYPVRFRDRQLIGLFERIIQAGKRAVIVGHIDHVDEISEETVVHIETLRRMGVQFFNQTVLLKGVNDDPELLAATFQKLHWLGLQPYYLFQARPAKGTLHFQVPLRHGVEIVHAVNRRLSGIQKTFRYVMSHRTGKIEILDMGRDDRLCMRYHQNKDSEKIGKVFSRLCREESCWLDDLPSSESMHIGSQPEIPAMKEG